MSISATQLRRLFAKANLLFTPSYHIIAYMLNRFTVLPQHQPPLSKVQLLFSVAEYFQKIVDIHSFVGIITQQLSNSATQQLSNSATQQVDCALKNGRFFHLSNDIIIFSHQFLQTASVLLGFFILNRKGR